MFADTPNVIQLHIPAGQLTSWINSPTPASYITKTAISSGTLNLHACSFPWPLDVSHELLLVSDFSCIHGRLYHFQNKTCVGSHVSVRGMRFKEAFSSLCGGLCMLCNIDCSISAQVLRGRSQHVDHRGLIRTQQRSQWNIKRLRENLFNQWINPIYTFFGCFSRQTIVITAVCFFSQLFPPESPCAGHGTALSPVIKAACEDPDGTTRKDTSEAENPP